MAGKPEMLKVIKEKIKENFNIFLGVYYKRGHDTRGTYANMTMEKDVKKLV